MRFFRYYYDLKIRHKLLYSYAALFMLILISFGSFTYMIVRRTVQENIESELKNSTAALLNMVRTAVTVSIKNHLRAVAEKNLEIVQDIHDMQQKGSMTREEAQARARSVLLSQTIGDTGYIACVDSKGTMVLHPERSWEGKDITDHAFVREMISRKEGYLEYQWRNPGDETLRPKALFMSYFEPWDWIINVSSYRNEFSALVHVDDFRDIIMEQRFGKSGYAFVMDGHGRMIIHPYFEGISILNRSDSIFEPLTRLLTEKNGRIEYLWQGPDQPRARRQLVIFNSIPEYDWVVAACSYLDESYAPLRHLTNIMAGTLIAAFLLVLPITFFVSGLITNPLRELIEKMEEGGRGNFKVRSRAGSADEVGRLIRYFNLFMERLQKYSHKLETEIAERKEAEEALKISEEKYRSVMHAAPDPIIVYDMKGYVTYLNPAFSSVFGWTAEECLGRRMNFVPEENWPETRKWLQIIAAGRKLPNVETRRYTKSGRIIDVGLSGAAYYDSSGRPAGSVIIHRDNTDLKRLEKEVLEVGDREQQKIGQDLHDDLCPHLIGIEGLLKVMRNRLRSADESAVKLLDQITELVREAIGKSRQLSRGLCPVHLVERGLETALGELAAKCTGIFDISCNFQCDHSVPVADSFISTHLFRITQEAVNNAVIHGQPTRIDVCLDVDPEWVHLTVEDNGSGIPEGVGHEGLGLRIMNFRAKLIGGVLSIDSGQGKGARVSLALRNWGSCEELCLKSAS
ncbi:MAG: cache domain-containing protein [Thermodesulfobacteriota bacterium]